ncbi:PAS domain S-box-containing protein [Paraburkholderia sp. BL27I4N3]|uniref:PAS domain-containing sensor histidine kinase n=1 Tax=Paraburkholderia sp. BL27I4N3 TaxID=1938805 RepID=UPI000E395D6E|nr:PAS domain-containing sensor histidine kinase [Paraburkholderia sp. BL27I4N3]REE21428.1 PAS domain S-box-containing protein [Paraburkholderia sp. BL27I4N3]
MVFNWNDAKRSAGAENDSDVPLEYRYQLLIDAVQDYAIFMLDPAGRVASWNSGARKIKGYAADEIIGRHFSIFYTPEDVAADKPGRELVLATTQGRAEDQGWRVRRDGSRFWADVTITAVHDSSGALLGFAKVTRDMTERMRLAELEHASEMSAQMQLVREDEQRRVARELHDDLGQQLTALKMGIAALEPRLASSSSDQQAGIAAAGELQRQIDSMMASLRRIAANLRPPMLDDLGFSAALEWMVDDFSHRFKVAATLRINIDDADLTSFAATNLYRIVQEALTNVARHAQASEVVVEISSDANLCTIYVADNGCGTTVEDAGKRGSFGLLGMRERVRLLRGTLTIDSAPGKGFRIAAQVPISAIRPDETPPA